MGKTVFNYSKYGALSLALIILTTPLNWSATATATE
jgi:hypothetical protein